VLFETVIWPSFDRDSNTLAATALGISHCFIYTVTSVSAESVVQISNEKISNGDYDRKLVFDYVAGVLKTSRTTTRSIRRKG
jgi:hypothetical protein